MLRLRQKIWKQIGAVAALGGILLLGVAILRLWQRRRKGIALSRRLSFQVADSMQKRHSNKECRS
jgi:hypothetical protein